MDNKICVSVTISSHWNVAISFVFRIFSFFQIQKKKPENHIIRHYETITSIRLFSIH